MRERSSRGGAWALLCALALPLAVAPAHAQGSAGAEAADSWRDRQLLRARCGDAEAQANTGVLYESGFTVRRSLVEAYKWYLLAERAGDPDAGRLRADLAELMRDSEREEAERRAARFAPERCPER